MTQPPIFLNTICKILKLESAFVLKMELVRPRLFKASLPNNVNSSLPALNPGGAAPRNCCTNGELSNTGNSRSTTVVFTSRKLLSKLITSDFAAEKSCEPFCLSICCCFAKLSTTADLKLK